MGQYKTVSLLPLQEQGRHRLRYPVLSWDAHAAFPTGSQLFSLPTATPCSTTLWFCMASSRLVIFTDLTQAELCKGFWKGAVIVCLRTSLYKEWEQHVILMKYTEERWVCYLNSQCNVLAVSEDQHLQKIMCKFLFIWFFRGCFQKMIYYSRCLNSKRYWLTGESSEQNSKNDHLAQMFWFIKKKKKQIKD